MRIAVDVTPAQINQAGTGIYVKNLVQAIKNLQVPDEIYTISLDKYRDMSQVKTIRTRLETLYRDIIWTNIDIPFRIRQIGCELLHMPANVAPIFVSCRMVATIHDTTVLLFPKKFPLWHRYYTRLMMTFTTKKAAKIITVSNQSKNDIINLLKVNPNKIHVVYHGVSSIFQQVPQTEIDRIRNKYGLSNFILTVGSLEPRKNITRIITAFARLRSEGYTGILVHVGPKGWLSEKNVRTLVSQLNLEDCIRFLGYVPLEDLVSLYNAAQILVYPSLYEGFGFPIIEAMACRCPVITSNISSMPEVAGDAALFIDPYNVEMLYRAMYRIWKEPDLTNDLVEKGLQRARVFSWERCAQETLSVYYKAVND